MRLVKFKTKDSDLWINPEMVQIVTTPLDEKKSVLIGHAVIFTLTEKVLVQHTPAEAAALLYPQVN